MITRAALPEDTEHPCPHCVEAVELGEPITVVPHVGEAGRTLRAWHYECFLRTVVGSVAHQMNLCGCHFHGATCHDDPRLSVRRAAQAATQLWKSNRERAEK